MTTPTSFRTSFAERSSKTHELRKDSLFNMVDETKTGSIDKAEFSNLFDVIRSEAEAENNEKMAMAKKQAATKRKTKLFGCVAAVMGVFLAVSVAANFAVIFSVVDGAMKTTVSTTGFLEVKGSDQIVQTAEAMESIPMLVAPVLPIEKLASVKTLKVRYMDGTTTTEAHMSIAGVRKHNSTYVEFITTVPGEVVVLLNGAASLVKNPTFANKFPEPLVLPICSANAECSAFHTTGIDTELLMKQATDELTNIGVLTGTTAHQRSLWSSTGYMMCVQYCNNGNWMDETHSFGSAAGSGRVAAVTVRYYTAPKGATLDGTNAARHVVYLLHGIDGSGSGLHTSVGTLFDQPEYVNFAFVYPDSCEFFLGMRTWNPSIAPWGAEGYNLKSFPQIGSLYLWLSGTQGSYNAAVSTAISDTIQAGTNHPNAEFSSTTVHCWSRQLAIGWSDGGRLAIQMNHYNRDTGVDQAVGLAGHPYMHVSTYGYTMSAYWDHLHLIGAEQGDVRCSGYTAPWWCTVAEEGTRNGGIYGNDGNLNIRTSMYYAQNDFYWAVGDINPLDISWWAAQRATKEVADQLLRCGDPTNAWPDCYVWPHGGCDDPTSAHHPCGVGTVANPGPGTGTVTYQLYESDYGSAGAGSGGAGCGEGVNNDQCKSKRTEWTDDCTTSGPYGGYCGTRVREEIFQIGGACDPQVYSPTNCNSYATNTGGSPTGLFTTGSGDVGDGPWGATGTMASATSHMNFLTDGLLMGDLLGDAMWGFIAEMTGEGNACGTPDDKFCCVQISATYAGSCMAYQWVQIHQPVGPCNPLTTKGCPPTKGKEEEKKEKMAIDKNGKPEHAEQSPTEMGGLMSASAPGRRLEGREAPRGEAPRGEAPTKVPAKAKPSMENSLHPATTGGRGEDATKGAPFDAAKEEDNARKGESSYMKKQDFYREKNLNKKDERFTHRVSGWAVRNQRVPR